MAELRRTLYYDPDLLAYWQEKRGVSDEEMAKVMPRKGGGVGITEIHFRRWKQKSTRSKAKIPRPDDEQISAICLRLNITPNDLWRDSIRMDAAADPQ